VPLSWARNTSKMHAPATGAQTRLRMVCERGFPPLVFSDLARALMLMGKSSRRYE
jgi:hypothetical protein